MGRRIAGLALVAAASVAAPAYAGVASAGPSPRPSLMAYDQATRAGGYQLVVQRPGGPAQPLSGTPVWALTPRWSPDGRWIAFSGCDRNGFCRIYVIRPDGSGLRQVSHDTVSLFTPSWMPDGRTLLAGRHVDDSPADPVTGGETLIGAVVALNVATGAERTVYQADQELLYPTWSATAKVVVFAAGTDVPIDGAEPAPGFVVPPSDLYTDRVESVGLDGSKPTVLAVGQTPDVSPDGRWIAYAGGATDNVEQLQVHVMSITGGGDHILGSFDWAGENPTWAPDGRSLLVTAQDNQSEVHVARLNIATGLSADLTAPGSSTLYADQSPATYGRKGHAPYVESKTYIQSATPDVGAPLDTCGFPDQEPGLGGVCFNVTEGDVLRVALDDATGRPVGGFIDVCGEDDCSSTSTTWLYRPFCGSVTIDLAHLPYAFHLWVLVDAQNGLTPAVAGGPCALPQPGTRGTAVVTFLNLR